MKLLHSIVITLLFSSSILSQENNNISNYYKAFDSIVGIENTNLINGLQFIDMYRSTENNHRFFNSHEFLNGSITYDLQLYNNLEIKYDLYRDQIILKLPEDKDYFQLNLNTNKVSVFNINNHVFKNFNNNTSLNELGVNGFLETVYNGKKIILYIKHKKSRKESIKNSKIESSFKSNNQFLYLYNGIFFLLKSKNKLKKSFPKQADNINEFYKDNSILLKRNPNNFMLKLFKLIDSQN